MAADKENLLQLVDEKIFEAQDLLKNCENLIEKRVEGSQKLKRKIQAELEFLNQVGVDVISGLFHRTEGIPRNTHEDMSNANVSGHCFQFPFQLKQRPSKLRPNHVISTNLTHLRALFEAAVSLTDVIAVLAPFPRQDEKQSNLLVDLVADGGATWIKVVARSARGLHFTWAGMLFPMLYGGIRANLG